MAKKKPKVKVSTLTLRRLRYENYHKNTEFLQKMKDAQLRANLRDERDRLRAMRDDRIPGLNERVNAGIASISRRL